MRPFSNLLIAVDFSSGSAHALLTAQRLAARDEAQLTVFHVVDDDIVEAMQKHLVIDDEGIIRDGEERLRNFCYEEGINYERGKVDVVLGKPFVETLKAIERHQPDLLVLGQRGTGKSRFRTGVLASQCVRKADVPVLLTDEAHEGPFKHIVCAIDFSETSKLAAEQALRMARVDGARLDFIHVCLSPKVMEYANSGFVVTYKTLDDFAPQMKHELSEFLRPLREDSHGVEFSEHVIERFSVSGGIIDEIALLGADLLVMGTRGRVGWNRLLFGTTAERVLREIPCSLLAVKPPDFEFAKKF